MNNLINRLREKESIIDNLLSSRSVLYNLEPIGIGTPYVESLTSYISRLALEHNVSVSSLMKKVFAQKTDKIYLKNNLSQGIFGDTAQYINGTSRVSAEYVNVLEQLTSRNDLQQLTMSSWTGIFSNNVLDKYRKWCPICLEEWKMKDIDLYEPLLWYISYINICDKHGIELQVNCPNCNNRLPYLQSNFIVGHCQYCSTFLGNKFGEKTKEDLTEEYKFTIENYKELIGRASSVSFLPTSKSISSSLNKLIKSLNINKANFAKLIGVSPSTLSSWLSNRRIPSNDNLIRIGWKTKIPIYNLICGDIRLDGININNNIKKSVGKNQYISKQETKYHLKNEISAEIPRSLKQIAYEKGFSLNSARDQFPDLCRQINEKYINYKKICWEEMLSEIEDKLLLELTQEIPLSFNEFVNKYGYARSTVKRHFPDLCREIVHRYKKDKERVKIERTKRIKREIKDVVLKFHQKGEYPYRKLVQKKLLQPAVFRNPMYREYWEKVVL